MISISAVFTVFFMSSLILSSGFLFRRASFGQVIVRNCKRLASTVGEHDFVQPGHVYFVATPVGNMADITLRGKAVLSGVDVICAEDTRNTIKLLKLLKIPNKRLLSHHEHNVKGSIGKIIDICKTGKSIAVVSDAGTPGISDPGAELAAALAEQGIPIHPIPGCSAVTAALSISGFQCSPFSFFGFLPTKGTAREAVIEQIAATEHTVVLYEAPHRIERTLKDLIGHGANVAVDKDGKSRAGEESKVGKGRKTGKHESVSSNGGSSGKEGTTPGAGKGSAMSNRRAVCCRELTKMHEQISRGSLAELFEAVQWGSGAADLQSDAESDDDNQEVRVHREGSGDDASGDDYSGDAAEEEGVEDSVVAGRMVQGPGLIRQRGEFTLVLGPVLRTEEGRGDGDRDREGKLEETLLQLRMDGVRRSEAVRLCVDMLGLPKSVVYGKALSIPDW